MVGSIRERKGGKGRWNWRGRVRSVRIGWVG